jgi:lipopolysaccharide/colanic/teichoic acid biosynthesis glycosyltransferase
MLDGLQTGAKQGHLNKKENPYGDRKVIPFPKAKIRIRPSQSPLMRVIDIAGGLVGTIIGLPFILIAMLAIWLEDRHNPFYVAERIGAGGKPFRFIKLRSISMRKEVRPDEIISARDPRVSRLGHFLRASKIDELPQFWHVLSGQMSLVGPRANVRSIVDAFTDEERRIVSIKPGITDLASIVFMNLGKVLEDSENPKLDYNRLVRPWKSRLALIYVENPTVSLSLQTMWLTFLAFFNHDRALKGVARIAEKYQSDPKLSEAIVSRDRLEPYPPPGATEVITSLQAS